MRTCLSPVPVLSSFEQAVKTIAATAVNVKILFIILSFKLKIISYTQRRRDPVGLRDVFQTEAVFVTREYVDIEPFDIAPQPERCPQPFGREVFVFVIVVSGQLPGYSPGCTPGSRTAFHAP